MAWSALSTAWVGFALWRFWWQAPTGHFYVSDALGYVLSVAGFVVPPLVLAVFGLCVRWAGRRVASMTRYAN